MRLLKAVLALIVLFCGDLDPYGLEEELANGPGWSALT